MLNNRDRLQANQISKKKKRKSACILPRFFAYLLGTSPRMRGFAAS